MPVCLDCCEPLEDGRWVCPNCGTMIDRAAKWPPRPESMGGFEGPKKRRGLAAVLRNPRSLLGIAVCWGCLLAGGMFSTTPVGDAAFAPALAVPLIAGLLLESRFSDFSRGLFWGIPLALAASPLVILALIITSSFA